MDPNIQKALNDKLYDKRKSGAFELEGLIRECLANNDHDRIQKIVHQLCRDYAYAVHQPHARNGGLIGLAAASIALGPEVARYLEEIVPPVLACFTDQDARVRYYACESMYNIAKVAKGEILLYFNEVFDALCKLAADSELSVKNGAELLDRLVKDIVSESAASYISVLQNTEKPAPASEDNDDPTPHQPATAFSLARFIPLLKDRITVLNPFTRMFLVSWITLLDAIPDLELVAYLPSFLGGLFKFLSDSNQDVHTATQVCLERFLSEIKKIARLKQGIALTERSHADGAVKRSNSSAIRSDRSNRSAVDSGSEKAVPRQSADDEATSTSGVSESSTADDDVSQASEDDWIPGQDVQVDHAKILDILVTFLGGTSEDEIQLTALRWIDSVFEICPQDILSFVPRLLTQVLPAISNDVEQVRQAASRVNTALMDYILSLPEDETKTDSSPSNAIGQPSGPAAVPAIDRQESGLLAKNLKSPARETPTSIERQPQTDGATASAPQGSRPTSQQSWNLDYEATVNALTLQFLNDHEATRVAALNWLIMLQRKALPGRKLEINDGTFPALLKTLSDSSDAVVTRDLVLLSQMFRNSDDPKFQSFMVKLLKLFCTDRRLLETRGNLVIRQLCVSLSAERIYRTLADCLEKDEDVEFASIMVQNLNNNLITAPELGELRKRLRNLETRDGQTFFVTLFRSWCHNAVATFSLCLLAQAYEQAYHLLQIFAELEMTVNMLIQVDKLVQLLESPVFTYLRLQLLEPERYPHLYKCLYGLLMLLPQSSAFAALKNRLNSVSAIGYLHIAGVSSGLSTASGSQGVRTLGTSTPSANPAAAAGFERPNRLKARDDGAIKWGELLEKFRTTQERARRTQRGLTGDEGTAGPASAAPGAMPPPPVPEKEASRLTTASPDGQRRGTPAMALRPNGQPIGGGFGAARNAGSQLQSQQQQQQPPPGQQLGPKVKTGLGNLSRFAGGVAGRKGKRI